MPDENDLFAEWQKTSPDERPDVEKRLTASVKRHAQAIVWKMLNEERADLVQDINADVMVELADFRQRVQI